MELYNSYIQAAEELLAGSSVERWDYDPARCWPDVGSNELVMQREAAFELGGSGSPAVSFACFTTDEKLIGRDEVWLCGPDLDRIRGDSPFARMVFFSVQDIGEADEAYRAIQEIEFAKYHVHPKGYMTRALSEECREQVRVSRAAVKEGISFRRVGFDYIRKYKENETSGTCASFFSPGRILITAPSGRLGKSGGDHPVPEHNPGGHPNRL